MTLTAIPIHYSATSRWKSTCSSMLSLVPDRLIHIKRSRRKGRWLYYSGSSLESLSPTCPLHFNQLLPLSTSSYQTPVFPPPVSLSLCLPISISHSTWTLSIFLFVICDSSKRLVQNDKMFLMTRTTIIFNHRHLLGHDNIISRMIPGIIIMAW